jgi:hypothetical protein
MIFELIERDHSLSWQILVFASWPEYNASCFLVTYMLHSPTLIWSKTGVNFQENQKFSMWCRRMLLILSAGCKRWGR